MFDRIRTDLTLAMKASDALVVSVLRMLLSELNYKKIDLQRDLVDDDVLAVLAREVKKRRESIESYTAGGRMEQAEQERLELAILQKYMPKMMSEDEVREEIKRLSEKEIKGLSDFGQIMRVVSPLFKGRAEGSVVAKIVKELT